MPLELRSNSSVAGTAREWGGEEGRGNDHSQITDPIMRTHETRLMHTSASGSPLAKSVHSSRSTLSSFGNRFSILGLVQLQPLYSQLYLRVCEFMRRSPLSDGNLQFRCRALTLLSRQAIFSWRCPPERRSNRFTVEFRRPSQVTMHSALLKSKSNLAESSGSSFWRWAGTLDAKGRRDTCQLLQCAESR